MRRDCPQLDGTGSRPGRAAPRHDRGRPELSTSNGSSRPNGSSATVRAPPTGDGLSRASRAPRQGATAHFPLSESVSGSRVRRGGADGCRSPPSGRIGPPRAGRSTVGLSRSPARSPAKPKPPIVTEGSGAGVPGDQRSGKEEGCCVPHGETYGPCPLGVKPCQGRAQALRHKGGRPRAAPPAPCQCTMRPI
jgi:hypothetical protein